MKRWLFALLFLPSVGWAQLFIGNTGEGVLLNEKIYLRDLYEVGAHEAPYFGKALTPRIRAEKSRFLKLKWLGVDEDLLLQKLSDIESRQPYLGVFLSRIIQYYQWDFIANLALKPDPTPLDPTAPARVPLARRFKTSILLHEANFKALSPEHRVALVIHEAISALSRVTGSLDCLKDICFQSEFDGRRITGLFFTRDYCPFQHCDRNFIYNVLNIQPKATALYNPAYLKFESIKLSVSGDSGPSEKFYEGVAPRSFRDFFALGEKVCAEMFPDSMERRVKYMLVSAGRLGFELDIFDYRAHRDENIDSFQSAVRVLARSDYCFMDLPMTTRKQCIDAIVASPIMLFFEGHKAILPPGKCF